MSLKNLYLDTIPILAGTYEKVADRVLKEIKAGTGGYICTCNAHMISEAFANNDFLKVLEKSTFNVIDGTPIVWWARHRNVKAQRTSGPDLMATICRQANEEGYKIFLYGSMLETLEKLKANLQIKYNNLKIAGSYSPPQMNLKPDFYQEHVDMINQSGADIVFVGLGCPKQEFWMAKHAPALKPLSIGVGAAFDFYSENLKRAPKWMQNNGLEWLYRFSQEPTRLWKRYTIQNMQCLYHLWKHRNPPKPNQDKK